jgi:aminopeptidase-like protein
MAVAAQASASDLGAELYALAEELYPICRSITGAGVRATLDVLERFVPLTRTNVPSGTKAFDWEIPREWNIRDAYIKNSKGERVVDFKKHTLHVVNYSMPVRAKMKLAELRPHLFSLPDHPEWIPYRTSYYRDTWGFCLAHRVLESLPDDEYEVCIDSTLEPGHLTWAEAYLPGESSDEVLVWTHICHPSLCNDNLSAIAVSIFLARALSARSRALSYRFVFAPTTIGAIAWLAQNESNVGRIKHGLVLASLGDAGKFVFKRSRRGNAEVDRAVEYALSRNNSGACEDFSPYGYDERQFCSPGFNLPVGRLTRTPNGRYPQYHTSEDNLQFISGPALAESLTLCESICELLERNNAFVNTAPKCEPRLGSRGLYTNATGRNPSDFEHALLWVLNQSDGAHDLLDIAAKSRIDFRVIADAAQALHGVGLLRSAKS